MDYILCNPLNKTVSIFSFTVTNTRDRSGTYVKSEALAFKGVSKQLIVNAEYREYQNKTALLLKENPGKDSKILTESTVETDVNNTDAQEIASIEEITDHNGILEGYKVVLK